MNKKEVNTITNRTLSNLVSLYTLGILFGSQDKAQVNTNFTRSTHQYDCGQLNTAAVWNQGLKFVDYACPPTEPSCPRSIHTDRHGFYAV